MRRDGEPRGRATSYRHVARQRRGEQLEPVYQWPEVVRLEVDGDAGEFEGLKDATLCCACGGVIARHDGGVHRGPDPDDSPCEPDCERRNPPDPVPPDHGGVVRCPACGVRWTVPAWLRADDLVADCECPQCDGELRVVPRGGVTGG